MKSISIILLAVLLAACGGKETVSREGKQDAAFADLRVAIEATVTDKERSIEVLSLVDDFEQDVDDLRALLVLRRAELRKLNANYDTTREELSRFSKEMTEKIEENRADLLAARIQLLKATTADEWAELARAETKAMQSISLSLQGI